jgi:hypothetical protein
VLATASDAHPLAALLRELNETILGRTLRFESSAGTSLTLEVAGRRVLRLTEVGGLSGAEACLAVESLEDEHKDALIKLMESLAAPGNELRVASLVTGQALGGVSVGLPVALLADLLLVELNSLPGEAAPVVPAPATRTPQVVAAAAPEPEEPPAVTATHDLVRLAQAMAPALMAWLIRGGAQDGASEGPEEMVSHLQGFLEDEAEAVSRQLDRVSSQPGRAICAVLGATLMDGHSLLTARSGEGLLLGVVDGDATQALLAAWAEAKV